MKLRKLHLPIIFVMTVGLSACTSRLNRSLVQAAFDGDSQQVSSIVKLGTSPDVYAMDGWTPLTAAACNGHLNTLKVLLKDGANINLPEAGGNTALFWASYYDYPDIVNYLLQQGASPTKACEKCNTPYQIAISRAHPEIAQMLQKATSLSRR